VFLLGAALACGPTPEEEDGIGKSAPMAKSTTVSTWWPEETVVGPAATATPTVGPMPHTEYVYAQATIEAGQTGYAIATCPEHSVTVGSGFSANPNVVFYSHMMYRENSWIGYAKNNTLSSQQITVFAVCLYNAPGFSAIQVYDEITVPPGEHAEATVACPEGSVVTNGSWAAKPTVRVYTSVKHGNGWQVIVQNTDPIDRELHVFAVCLEGTGWTTTSVTDRISIPAHNLGSTVGPKCESGQIVTGGGFSAHSDLVVYNSTGPYKDSQWWTSAQNPTGASLPLSGQVVCLSRP
jgi:hypothetical protein